VLQHRATPDHYRVDRLDMADDKDSSFAVARYDAMCRAIAEAHRVDEVKNLRDQAAALQAYARMAHNYDAEKRCAEIRLRAERRAGELLVAMDKAKGGRPSKTGAATEPVSTIADLGITKKQSSTWQRLADVPEGRFETLLNRETAKLPPTAHNIIGEDARLNLEADLNERYGSLSEEELKAKLTGLPKGFEECFWNVANMDKVTGMRPSDPKPSVETLQAAEQALGDFLARFTGPGFKKGSRVSKLIEEARSVVGYMIGAGSTRH
jgi:hypothetical protein